LRFKVPQNIDMQDRILGPLTLVQFVYAVIGFGLCYVIWRSIPAPISYLLVIPVGGFVICLDFLKINERPFWDFFKAAMTYASAPKQRFWHQGVDTDLNVEIYSVAKADKQTASKNLTPEQIADLARGFDSANGQMLIRR